MKAVHFFPTNNRFAQMLQILERRIELTLFFFGWRVISQAHVHFMGN